MFSPTDHPDLAQCNSEVIGGPPKIAIFQSMHPGLQMAICSRVKTQSGVGRGGWKAIRYWLTSWCASRLDSRRAATVWRWGGAHTLGPPHTLWGVCSRTRRTAVRAATHGALRGRCRCFRLLGRVRVLVRCAGPLARFPHLMWAPVQHGCPCAQFPHSRGSWAPSQGSWAPSKGSWVPSQPASLWAAGRLGA